MINIAQFRNHNIVLQLYKLRMNYIIKSTNFLNF